MFSRQHFQGQRESEEVLQIIHRHWFNILSHLLLIFLFSFLIIASFLALPRLFPEMLTPQTAGFLLFFENTFFIFIWLFGFLVWIDYYFDVWIITNERIINIEQKGLFVREVSELNFSRIQDVTTTVEGVIPTILNFGDVHIQTAGEENRFVFRQVPDPYHLKDVIMQASKNTPSDGLNK